MGYFMKVFLLACQITGQFLSKVTLGNHTSSFYFESLSNDYGFYQGQEFLLVYKDQANELLWSDSSNSCRYTDQGSTQIGSIANTGPCQLKVYCDTVGTVLFTLNITETNVEQFYITLKPSTFHWYVVLLDPTTGNQINSINSNTNATIKLWIVDYSDEDFQEVAGNATKPSEKSKQISESFYLLGEYPTIMVDSNVIISSTPVFDAQESTWDFHVNAQNVTGGTKLSVKGQTVSLLGRTVGNTYFNLFVEKYTDTTLPITSSSLNSNSESYFQIFPDYCSKGVGFAISSSYGDRNVLFSQNMFYSSGYQYLYTFPSIVNSIVAIVSTTNTIVVLSDNGIYYNNETNFLYSSGIPSSVSLNRLKAMDYCEQNNLGMPYSFNNVVVAWNSSLKTTSSSSTLSLYLSSDGGVEFKPIEIQLGAGSTNRFISDITILPSNSSLCLIISNSGDYQVKLYNIVYNEFISGYMSSGGNWATTIRATSFPASQILIWGSKLQYSPDGGINSLSMEIDLASGEIISNVITGFEGRFALATSRNRVFVGFIGFTSLVETFSGISSIELTSFMFDLSNNLVLLTPSTNPNQLISKRVIPLNQKSINSDGLTVKCPFYKWQMSTSNFDYTLDYGDILKINGTLVSDADTLNTLSVLKLSKSLDFIYKSRIY
ncbi:hypothetical protein BC833DRAFT_239007 [Globomyces pollinis-pini]|nr:hypothetical protein BC833DRAFT_239007 [Globomyces pollinis-pini]